MRAISRETHGHIRRSARGLFAAGVLLTACRLPTGHGEWSVGYTAVEGTIHLRDGTPYHGGLFVEYAGRSRMTGTTQPGVYRLELAEEFPEGVPKSPVTLRLGSRDGARPDGLFLDSLQVRFSSTKRDRPLAHLHIRQP